MASKKDWCRKQHRQGEKGNIEQSQLEKLGKMTLAQKVRKAKGAETA